MTVNHLQSDHKSLNWGVLSDFWSPSRLQCVLIFSIKLRISGQTYCDRNKSLKWIIGCMTQHVMRAVETHFINGWSSVWCVWWIVPRHMNMNEYIPKQQGHSVKGLSNLNFSLILEIVPTCNKPSLLRCMCLLKQSSVYFIVLYHYLPSFWKKTKNTVALRILFNSMEY